MDKTVGLKDARFRTAIGALTGSLSILGLVSQVVPTMTSPLLGLISIIMLVTAYTGLCPAYSLLGLSTDT